MVTLISVTQECGSVPYLVFCWVKKVPEAPCGSSYCNRYYHMSNGGKQMGILHDVEILVPIIHSEPGMINMLLAQVFENLCFSKLHESP